jgi:hypothetical protein
VRIFFINNNGGGFSDSLEVPSGTTVAAMFNKNFPNEKPESYMIRVNRKACGRDQVLQDEDRMSVTPVKIEGA